MTLELCPNCMTFNRAKKGTLTCRKCGTNYGAPKLSDFSTMKMMVSPSPWAVWRLGHRRCPYCRGWVRREASVCRHCQRDLAEL